MNEDKRLARKLRNADRRDRAEQKLGIDRTVTKLRDERALRAMKRVDKERSGK